MKDYIKHDEWCIIEEGFNSENNRITESLMSLGNGKIGHRANFEEDYSGDHLQGQYTAGVFFPDKTRVGWWKNGYPDYFAKVINAPNWIGIGIEIDDEKLDLSKCDEVKEFSRILNMKQGWLERKFIARIGANEIKIVSKRFLSIVNPEIGIIRYSVTLLNFDGTVCFKPYIDADIANEDSNYDDKFWEEIDSDSDIGEGCIVAKTKKTEFDVPQFSVGTAMTYSIFFENEDFNYEDKADIILKDKYVANVVDLRCYKGEETIIYKYGAVLSSLDYEENELLEKSLIVARKAKEIGFEALFEEHKNAWEKKWKESDITIEGDIAAQQAIRFNIFQLDQTYTGKDSRLNIGPKGFTGEKYGGSTYWDTEAYCLPFYLGTADPVVSKNLLIYRYKHLPRAIINAEKLGFKDGAALYPMVTMTGDECHNEWEITFEELHRNGAIAFAIFNYFRHTGDKQYVIEYGFEVLLAISRFWSQRVNYSESKKKYVMLGVTGPNEYENNVNNNWYTNTIACWCMNYTMETLDFIKGEDPDRFKDIVSKTNFKESIEVAKWKDIIENMYFPEDKELGVYLQQDGFLDKDLTPVRDLDPKHLPINQNWSWDRILRSCYIKQADVLQGIYLLEEHYDQETINRNFDFYEPLTVHESSLSPCIHSILAAKLGDIEHSYQLYLRTSRLDLDDYNNDTEDGCHITSMGGTWMSIVKGFGGMRIINEKLILNPQIPSKWKSYSFKIVFRGSLLRVFVSHEKVEINNESQKAIEITMFGALYKIEGKESVLINTN